MLDGKNTKPVAVVTGANRGLGLETARQLAQRGLRVIVTSRNISKGETAVENLLREGLDILFQLLDVTSEASVADLGSFIHSRCGRAVGQQRRGVPGHSRQRETGNASVFNASLKP